MVNSCWVSGCKNNSKKTDVRKVSYFGIPLQNPDRFRQWLDNIGRSSFASKPPQYLASKKVCSEHFETTMFSISRRKLKSNATPTIFKRDGGYEDMNRFDAPSCSTVASSSEEQEKVNKENKSPIVDLPTQLPNTSKLSSFTTKESRLRSQIRILRRRNLRLEQSLALEPKVTEEQFINFCKEKLGENMAKFFKMQLKLAKSKGKGCVNRKCINS